MNITKIKIRKLHNPVQSFANENDTLIAYVSVTFDDVFMVHSIKLTINKDSQYFICMPKEKLKDGSYKDIFHAVESNFRLYIIGEIVNAYCNDDRDKFGSKRK